MENLTQKEMLRIMLDQFKEYKEDWKDFRDKQEELNNLMIRNDDSLKWNWKFTWASFTLFMTGTLSLLIKIIFF